MEKLSEKAAAISGALTGAVVHLFFGALVFGMPGAMTGAYGSMYYGMMQVGTPAFAFGALLYSIVFGLVGGAIVGWLVAITYNWGLRK